MGVVLDLELEELPFACAHAVVDPQAVHGAPQLVFELRHGERPFDDEGDLLLAVRLEDVLCVEAKGAMIQLPVVVRGHERDVRVREPHAQLLGEAHPADVASGEPDVDHEHARPNPGLHERTGRRDVRRDHGLEAKVQTQDRLHGTSDPEIVLDDQREHLCIPAHPPLPETDS